MENIIIKQDGQEFFLEMPRGTNLLTALRQAGISAAAPCGGSHICGKCVVHANGRLSKMTKEESDMLDGRAGRLACMTTIQGGCLIEIERAGTGSVITSGVRRQSSNVNPLFLTGYGVAVDIGTTTLAAYLYDSRGGAALTSSGVYNQQRRYGADVMTRIAFDCDDKEKTLHNVICQQLSAIISELCASVGVHTKEVSTVVLTGNTVMLHFVAGLDTSSLALTPYTPISLFGDWLNLSISGLEKARFYLAPCISAYIGADITCDILASGILNRPGNHLLLDAGTNGEMVLKYENRLICCSAAAGPAFEGAGISCGSEAVPGAICHVNAKGSELRYKTVGGRCAESICGSGLIDAVASCIKLGLITPGGRINTKPGKITFPDCNVTLNQKDIRQLQLAKGAVRAGIEVMLHSCGLSYMDINSLILCGGFGSFLSPLSAEIIGMLPPGCACKTETLGNTAGVGASELLLRKEALKEADKIAKLAQCIELSASPIFMEKFMEHIGFK